MRESNFVTELRRGLEKINIWSYKIPDAPYASAAMRFAPEKPGDIIAMADGTGLLIECKQIKKWSAFGMKNLTRSQVRNLFLYQRAGGISLVALNVRIPGEFSRFLFFDFLAFQAKEKFSAKELRSLNFCVSQKFPVLSLEFWKDPEYVWGLG